MKLVVLDANAYWTEQLFSACPFADQTLLLKPREVRAHWERHGSLFGDGHPRPLGESTYEQRFALPTGWMFYGWPLARKWIARSIRSFVGDDAYTLVVCFPQYRTILDELSPDLSVYYNYDDYRDNWPQHAQWLAEAERETVRATDLTFCIARQRTEILAEHVPNRASDIHHVPIGCTPKFIADSPAVARQSAPPSTLQPHVACDGITAGYIGTLGYRFDHAFLTSVAKRRRDVTFVLGGREPDAASDSSASWWADYQRLREQPNVHFIGWVPHDALGSHLASFNVLIMPYAACRFNTNACPAKLWDYMGTSRPIVANDVVPEVNLWDDVIHITEAPDDFASALDEALAESPQLPARRLKIARNHTYSALGRRAANLLASALVR